MKIKTQITISLMVFVILSGIIIFSVVSSNNQLNEIQKQQQLIEDIRQSSFDLYYLENDYTIHGGTLSVEHWNAEYDHLTMLLGSLAVADPAQQAVIRRMDSEQKDLKNSFASLVAVKGSGQVSGASETSQELREFLASTLTTQTLMSSSSELSRMAKAETVMVGQRTILIIALSIVLLMLFVLLNYLFIYRRALRSISALQKGAERIGSGDLEVNVESVSDDELGYLTRTFNDMASSLQESRARLLSSKVVLEEEITERKNAEAVLRESEMYLGSILRSSPIGIGVTSHRIIMTVNPRICQMLGYAQEELIGKSSRFVYPTEQEYERVGRINQEQIAKNGYGSVETRWQKKDGSVIEILLSSTPLDGANFAAEVTFTATDITGRKVSEMFLRESEQKFRGIFDNINDGLQIHEIGSDGKPGKFIEVNDVACRMLQYSREELLQHSPLDFATEYHSKPLEEIFKENMTAGQAIFETDHRRKDGTVIPVEVHTHTMTLQGKLAIVAVVRDITERKRAEVILMWVNHKLNVLSRLTRQDVTTQLFIVKSYLELARTNDSTEPVMPEKNLANLGRAVRSIEEITEFTKDYQNLGENPAKWQNVRLTFLFAISHVTMRETEHRFETGALEIFADPSLEIAFQGLIENSLIHGGHVTRIRVTSSFTADGVIITFEDDGAGIPCTEKEKIFLYGMGARASVRGLFFIREILDITGITIRETGEPGIGARFEMTVPVKGYRMSPRPE